MQPTIEPRAQRYIYSKLSVGIFIHLLRIQAGHDLLEAGYDCGKAKQDAVFQQYYGIFAAYVREHGTSAKILEMELWESMNPINPLP